MNTAEIKLDLFRKIDGMSEMELKWFHEKVLALINSNREYILSDAERSAVEEAMQDDQYESLGTTDNIVAESKKKYPNLKFK